MTSIRRKLFMQISAIILLFILLLFLANSFLLESIYFHNTKNKIIRLYEVINQMETSDINPHSLYQLLLDNQTFLELIIIDEANTQIFLPLNPLFSNDGNLPPINPPKQPPAHDRAIETIESINDKVDLIRFHEPNNKDVFVALNGHLDNGFYIEIRMHLASLSTNVTFFNQFIMVAGVMILLITFPFANLSAKHFTGPIMNMLKVTDHIKRLDFSQSCDVLTNDEIGKLAENINEMSYALKENLDDLKTRNQQLTKEIHERLKIDEQRKMLLSNVSHELKTPLSLIQGYSEGLKIKLHTNPEKINFYCDVIIDEAVKMDSLVSQLLDINRIQFGDFPLHKEKLGAKAFIGNILAKHQPTMKDSAICFTKDLSGLDSEPNLLLDVDALRCEQVITNLISNAVAYVDEEKNIHIKSELLRVPDSDNEVSRHLRLTISNSHPPVNEEELANWWNSFYKADQARTRENGGYGLGLSIVQAIQEADHNQYGVHYQNGLVHFYVDFDVV